ncbi:hypothetical protein RJ639_038444 [Escallonia herrerae]|uniref:Myb/SANT-like DNA-binding domain-containing protein n=1 Tax=Escallonia herrerae TaxID=1293975 RepID=A0AA88WZL2_9ASTE|nr:hypothetical protein RJ639_038444 [Escallonia herrerae]
MDNLGVRGGYLSGPNGGFLDLESPINRHQQTQLGHISHTHHHLQTSMPTMTGLEDDHSIGVMEVKGLSPTGLSMNFGKGKGHTIVNAMYNSNHSITSTSDEDEPSFMEDGENFTGAKGKKGSPWQRMKWTDSIVRLLIQVVACVGDDGTLEGVEGLKRRSGILQKKGKWKTVSNIMIAKGCYVSPQQCEDKFNDLNKRYKRLNDILGRGTSCRVVESPALMDSMPQLSAKVKDDVKKILSSKHLFYQEMCAYHNGQRIPNCNDLELQVHSLPQVQCSKDNNGGEAEAQEHDESEDDESDDEGNNIAGGDVERDRAYSERKKGNEVDGNYWSQFGGQDALQTEMAEFFGDTTKSRSEQIEWVKKRMLQLQEQRVGIQADAFELEKRRFKWQRFCSTKDRELEISRLENERLILENERMALQLKQKKLEIETKSSVASFDPTSLSVELVQGRDQIDLGRHQ